MRKSLFEGMAILLLFSAAGPGSVLAASPPSGEGEKEVRLTEVQRQAGWVSVMTVEKKSMETELRRTGTLNFDEEKVSIVSARVAGREVKILAFEGQKGRYLHFHLLGHHHEPSEGVERSPALFGPQHKSETLAASPSGDPEPFPARWAMIHGFVAGFGVGPFAMFVYTVAAPQMGSPWLGFLPGFLFGLGTTAILMILGGLFGASLKTTRKFDDHEIAAIGLRTGSLTLLGGGVVFVVGGLLQEGLHLYEREIDLENWMIGIIMAGVAIPVLVYSIWKVLRCRKDSPPRSLQGVV